jgi:hypothetical protein
MTILERMARDPVQSKLELAMFFIGALVLGLCAGLLWPFVAIPR